MRRTLLSAGAPLLACIALAACDPSASTGGPSRILADLRSVVFLTQETTPAAFMDALFTGRITRDAQGCLRLDTSERHTVVWPHGYTLESRGDGLLVRDEQGREVGTVGGSFRVGGGEVPSLDYVEHLSPEARTQAAESCPGRYWLASPER